MLEERAVGSHRCDTCELLKEYYQLKFNQFMLAGRSSSARGGEVDVDEQLMKLKDEALDALTALMRHAKTCYGLVSEVHDEAA